MSYIPEPSLLIRISNGNDEAFTELYTHTKQDTYRLVYFLASNKNEVDDMMSEVYLELYKSISSYNVEQSFQSWFNGLIVRQVRSYKRKSWRVMRLFQKLQQYVGDWEKIDAMTDDNLANEDEMYQHLNKLSEKYKEVIVLRYYKQLSLDEIAEILHVPVGTIKSRHHYALKQLRQYYTQTDKGKEHVSYGYGK